MSEEEVLCIVGTIISVAYAIVGIFGNTLTIGLFVKFKKFRSHFGFYILSLAIADLSSCAIVIPMRMVFFITNLKWRLGRPMCIMEIFIRHSNLTAAALLIFFIAINRYLRICHNLRIYDKFCSTRSVQISIVSAWIYPFVVLGAAGIAGGYNFEEESGKCRLDIKFVFIVLTITYCVLWVSMSYCYIRIYLHVKSSTNNPNFQSCRDAKDNLELLKKLVVTSAAYNACFLLPKFVLWGVYSNPGSVSRPVLNILIMTPYYTSIVINPVIYGLMSKEYRKGYGNLLNAAFGKINIALRPNGTQITQSGESTESQQVGHNDEKHQHPQSADENALQIIKT